MNSGYWLTSTYNDQFKFIYLSFSHLIFGNSFKYWQEGQLSKELEIGSETNICWFQGISFETLGSNMCWTLDV